MRIAQIAPLMESCPPHLYGGTERIVSYLTEELVRQGHDVTLFASGDSYTTAQLEPSSETALRLDPKIKDPIPDHIIMLDNVRARAEEFDVLHFVAYPVVPGLSICSGFSLSARGFWALAEPSRRIPVAVFL